MLMDDILFLFRLISEGGGRNDAVIFYEKIKIFMRQLMELRKGGYDREKILLFPLVIQKIDKLRDVLTGCLTEQEVMVRSLYF